jgi:DNA-binding transcriptional MerR regulator
MLLTISQLASHCGVTVRAIRHYHQRGLLAEPDRDASGYRRYGADAVVALIRIKTLADAGVPLGQIRGMLDATPAGFTSTVSDIDRALQQQISDLERRREALTKLLAGERLVLPDEVVDLLDEMRAMGVSDWTVSTERDGWILLAAIAPDTVAVWAREKQAALGDAEFRKLYLAADEARDWDPDDPRLDELAAWMIDWAANRRDEVIGAERASVPVSDEVSLVETLLTAQLAEASPAWRRLGEMSRPQLTAGAKTGLDLDHGRHRGGPGR